MDLAIIALILAMTASTLGLWWALPEARVSAYRTKLWQLRDGLVDEVLNGSREPTPELERLVEEIEGRIRSARLFNPITVLVLRNALRRDAATMDPGLAHAQRDPSLEGVRQALLRADVIHFFTGSISGFLLCLPVLVVYGWRHGLRRQRRDGSTGTGVTVLVEQGYSATIAARPVLRTRSVSAGAAA